MEEKHEELEKFLLQSTENDGEKIAEATEYLTEILKQEDAIDNFFVIIRNSKHPIAISQAIIQVTRLIRAQWKTIDDENKCSLATLFLSCLNDVHYSGKPLEQIIGALSFFFDELTEAWSDLLEYIVAPVENEEMLKIKLNVFSKCIKLFEDEQIAENIEAFNEIAFNGLKTMNWETIFYSLQVISRLIEVSAETLSPTIEFISTLPEIVIQQNFDIQSRFFDLISSIILDNETTECIIEPILTISQSDEIDPQIAISAINSLNKVIKGFDGEHVDTLLTIALQQGVRFVELKNEIPKDILDFVEAVIDSFPHGDSYTTIKEKIESGIGEATESFITSSIILLIPVVEAAPELFTGEEVDFVSSVIKAGIESGFPLAIEAACNLITSSIAVSSISVQLAQLIPSLIPHISSELPDLSFSSFNAIDAILEQDESHNDETLELIWNMRELANQDNIQTYLHCLQNCIRKSPQVGSDFINAVLEFIEQYVTEPIQNIDLASSCLSVISAIISREEAHVDKLPITVPIINECFSGREMNSFINALKFIADISTALGESAVEFISPYIPEIMKILKKNSKSVTKLVWKTSLEVICRVIRHSHTLDLLHSVSHVIRKKLRTNDENKLNEYLLDLKQITKFLNSHDIHKFYRIIIDIARVAEGDELLSTCFLCLAKLVKYSNTDMHAQLSEDGLQLCQEFIEGELSALDGKQLADADTEIFTNLVEDFTIFASEIAGISQEASKQLCEVFMSIAASRPYEKYREMLLTVYLLSIEKDTITQESIQAIFEFLPQIVETATPNGSQHDSVYLLNILLKKFPTVVESVKQILPLVLEWWNFAFENYNSYRILASNIASFIINCANNIPELDLGVIKQAIQVFPPEDVTEVVDFSTYLITFMSSHEIDAELQLLIARGTAKLLTMNQTTLQKTKLSQETIGQLVSVLKQLCENPANAAAAHESVACSEGKLAKLDEILQ